MAEACMLAPVTQQHCNACECSRHASTPIHQQGCQHAAKGNQGVGVLRMWTDMLELARLPCIRLGTSALEVRVWLSVHGPNNTGSSAYQSQ